MAGFTGQVQESGEILGIFQNLREPVKSRLYRVIRFLTNAQKKSVKKWATFIHPGESARYCFSRKISAMS